jgi:hypothetical protein
MWADFYRCQTERRIRFQVVYMSLFNTMKNYLDQSFTLFENLQQQKNQEPYVKLH